MDVNCSLQIDWNTDTNSLYRPPPDIVNLEPRFIDVTVQQPEGRPRPRRPVIVESEDSNAQQEHEDYTTSSNSSHSVEMPRPSILHELQGHSFLVAIIYIWLFILLVTAFIEIRQFIIK